MHVSNDGRLGMPPALSAGSSRHDAGTRGARRVKIAGGESPMQTVLMIVAGVFFVLYLMRRRSRLKNEVQV